MAYVAMHSTFVTGGVAGESMVEGLAVEISPSGLHGDLPTVMKAGANSMNVFVALIPPDQFPRPTPVGFFRRPDEMNTNHYAMVSGAFDFSIDTHQYGDMYNIGPSMLEEPTALSGWMVQLHKGGAYFVTSACFTANANLVQGALIKVGTGGKWEYTSDASVAVGYVREMRGTGMYIVLERSVK